MIFQSLFQCCDLCYPYDSLSFHSSALKDIFPTTAPPPRAWSYRISSLKNQQVLIYFLFIVCFKTAILIVKITYVLASTLAILKYGLHPVNLGSARSEKSPVRQSHVKVAGMIVFSLKDPSELQIWVSFRVFRTERQCFNPSRYH